MAKFKKIYVEITNMCNKNCSFCSNSERTKKEMSLEEFELVLKKIKNYTNYIYLHIKGEPLLHSKFNKILELCNKYNIRVNITTNGTLLLQQVDVLINNNCVRQINVSLHSFEDGDSTCYLENIFLATKNILRNSSIIVQYRFWALKNGVIDSNNLVMLKKIISAFKLNESIIDDLIFKDNILLLDNLYLNKASLFTWPSLNNQKISESGKCYGTITHIGILSDGTVVPCCLDAEGIIDLGNIFSSDLCQITNSQRFIDIKTGFQNKKISEELCQKCGFRCHLKNN